MNAVDIVVLLLLLGSGLFALLRGFVHEVLAMAAWIVAPLVGFWSLPYTSPLARTYISNATIADIAAGASVFLLVLLVCSLITHAIARTIHSSAAISSVDRSLGFAFGALRGLVLATLLYMVVNGFIGDAAQPDWLTQAKSRPVLQYGEALIRTLLPPQLGGKAKDAARDAVEALDQARKAKETFEQLQSPRPRAADPQPGQDKPIPAYDSKGLERLIENGDHNGQPSRSSHH